MQTTPIADAKQDELLRFARLSDAIDVLVEVFGFPAARARTVARKLQDAGALPLGTYSTPPMIDARGLVTLILGVCCDATLRETPTMVAQIEALEWLQPIKIVADPTPPELQEAPHAEAGVFLEGLAALALRGEQWVGNVKIEVAPELPELVVYFGDGIAERFAVQHAGGANERAEVNDDHGRGARDRSGGVVPASVEAFSGVASQLEIPLQLREVTSELAAKAKARMATTKTATAEPDFRVPTLGEADPVFADIERCLRAAVEARGKAEGEIRAIEADLRKTPARRPMPAGVAARVGDVVDADDRLARVKALKTTAAECEAAEGILRARLSEQRGPASRAVCDAVRGEYAWRVSELCKALEAACAAHAKVNHLINELEANDVAWQGLGIFRAPWLGERTANLIREAREAGYVR